MADASSLFTSAPFHPRSPLTFQQFQNRGFEPPNDRSFAVKSCKLDVHKGLWKLVWISGGKPYLSLFFHLFKVQRSLVNHTQGQGLITLGQVTHCFEVFLNILKDLESRFFLVVPIRKQAHTTVCTIVVGPKDDYTSLFHKY